MFTIFIFCDPDGHNSAIVWKAMVLDIKEYKYKFI